VVTEHPSPERVNILLPAGDERGDAALVARILEMLRAHPLTGAALASVAATPPAGFVSLADLDQGPPPAGVPFYNEAIGVLSVPAPRGDAVGAVRAALGALAATLDIQPETSVHTQ
jgi:hypothetical protein